MDVASSAALQLLSGTVDRESHVLLREPDLLASHLHNVLFVEHGEEGVAGPLLDRARTALSGRPWLRQVNRPVVVAHPAALRVFEHRSRVTAVAWSPDMRLLASGDVDGVVRLWDWERGEVFLELPGAEASISALSWSPAARLAAGDENGVVQVWDPATWEREIVWRAPSVPEHGVQVVVVWSLDGTLAVAADDHVVLVRPGVGVWRQRRLSASVSGFAWAPSADRLAFASSTRLASGAPFVGWWDVGTDRERLIPWGGGEWFDSVAWLPDGRTLLLGEGNGPIVVWDMDTQREAHRLSGPRGSATGLLAPAPDGTELAAARDSSVIHVFDLPTGRVKAILRGHTFKIAALAWSSDGRVLASGGLDESVRLWDPRFDVSGEEEDERIAPVGAVAWSPDGETLAGASHEGVQLFDGGSGRVLRALPVQEGDDSVGIAAGVGWSSQGSHLALHDDFYGEDHVRYIRVDGDEWVRVRDYAGRFAWSPARATLAVVDRRDVVLVDADTGSWRHLHARPGLEELVRWGLYKLTRSRRIQSGHTAWISSIAWSPSGRLLASCDYDGTVVVWDIGRRWRWWRRHARFFAHEGNVEAFAWSPDDRRLASGNEAGLVRVHDVEAKRESAVLPSGARLLAWSPDGRALAVVGRPEVSVFDPSSGEVVARLDDAGSVDVLAWSSTGRFLAAGCWDEAVRLWDVQTGRRVAAARCLSRVTALHVSDDGRVVRAADDGAGTGGRPVPYVFEFSEGGT
jgi:WD40 repeat protein